MSDLFASAVAVETPADTGPVYDRNGVRRSKDGRPYVKVPCRVCTGGRVPGARAGTTKNCPACKGKGADREVLYTRCTSFVGVLESRKNLEAWQRRITLLGLAVDGTLWSELLSCDPNDRDAIDAIADRAFEIGDGHAAAQKGTDLHALTECVDRHAPLVTESGELATDQDRRDMAAYVRMVVEHRLTWLGSEQFVVHDRLKIGGTFDRLAQWPANPCPCGKPVIYDTKTGRVDYGQGKMAQQLAVYAHSDRYDPVSGDRSPLEVCTTNGLIGHVPQGTGTASLHVIDLEAGIAAVAISAAVREHRRISAGWLKELPNPA